MDPTYLLDVDLTLTATSARDDFENGVINFLNAGGFGRLAGRPSLSPAYLLRRDTSQQERRSDVYLHKWLIPTVADLDLAALMYKSADDATYKAVDRYVALEIQEFTYFDPLHLLAFADRTADVAAALRDRSSPLPNSPTRPRTVNSRPRYVHVVHMLSTPHDYGLYSFIALNLAYYMAKAGWYNAGISWNVTGRLRTFTELWRVDSGPVDASLETMLETLRSVYPRAPTPPPVTYIDVPGIYEQLSASSTRHLLDEYAYQDGDGRWLHA